MLNETYRRMLDHKSVIRETFMYGRQRAAQIGAENVFDYSLGNPSVPCPPQLTQAMTGLLAFADPVELHGYCPSQGDPAFRRAVAAQLERQFGLPYTPEHIFPTTGAARRHCPCCAGHQPPGGTGAHLCPLLPGIRAVCGWHRRGTGRRAPQMPDFQPNLEALEQMLCPAPPVC